jgi:photoactive yellow protein
MSATSSLPARAQAAARLHIPTFDSPELLAWLEHSSPEARDGLPFGVITMVPGGVVEHYNKAESALSGLRPSRVIGRNFFTSVAPCTNNFMIAHRFETEPEIDDVCDYVFTFRIAPLRVRLRMLQCQAARSCYLVVERRT